MLIILHIKEIKRKNTFEADSQSLFVIILFADEWRGRLGVLSHW